MSGRVYLRASENTIIWPKDRPSLAQFRKLGASRHLGSCRLWGCPAWGAMFSNVPGLRPLDTRSSSRGSLVWQPAESQDTI